MIVVAYINQGGLRSYKLYKLMRCLLLWAHRNICSVRAVHMPHKMNQGLDMLSRSIFRKTDKVEINIFVEELQELSVNISCLDFGPKDCKVILKPRHVPKVLSTPFKAQVITFLALLDSLPMLMPGLCP